MLLKDLSFPTYAEHLLLIQTQLLLGGHILVKMKFPVFSPVLQKFSLCYFYVETNN